MISREQRIVAAALIAAGVAIGVEAMTFEVGFLTDPVGPKALPLVVAALLVFAGSYSLVRPGKAARWPVREAGFRIVAAAGAFVAYAVALPTIGFFLSTTLVVMALSALYGAPRAHGLAAATALSGVLWLLFVRLLALPLPVGDLWIR
ncbi:MAG: tripartite tricarboxylate transporter TctB family protein [Gemmatimonadetes bacterium]|nr:tripartite tricarboxylate transporter TctB family protein [Gemmatimonadota bacterium]MDA1104505.1 tripartite tricarboxylate transporter TctB family protein [Gemmatimonadota bacterium]